MSDEGVAKSSNQMIERRPRSIYARIRKESFVLLNRAVLPIFRQAAFRKNAGTFPPLHKGG